MGLDHVPSPEKDSDLRPLEAVRTLDPAIFQKLPTGTTVLSVISHGTSHWTQTARLQVECRGQPAQYFLKTVHGDRGRKVVSGEYRSMTAIYAVMPTLVPKPVAWGSYETLPGVHFFLCEFRAMSEELPGVESFPQRMAQLHGSGTSPDGRFGFFEPTCHGHTPIDHGWHETWEGYFTATTKRLLQMEQDVQGPNQDISDLAGPFLAKVIPRLLRPLETDGRSIKPSLIHGDLWHGNVATDAHTLEPIVFDAASSYAHNEWQDELGVWRQPWNDLGEAHRARYHEYFPPSSPAEDCDDRNALYATRVNILDSILYTQDKEYRQMLIKSMRELVDKFPGGYEEWRESQG